MNKRKMKITQLRKGFIFLCICSAFILASCNNEDDTANSDQEKAAADAIINAISPESGGAITQTDEAVAKASMANTEGKNLDEPSYECGMTYNDSVTASGGQGNFVYSMNVDWEWTLNCSELDESSNFEMGFFYNRQYTSLRMGSDDTADGNMTVTGMELQSDVYVVNATAVYNGSQVSNVGNNNALTSEINCTVNNLTYDKNSMEISSGMVAVSLSGTFNEQESLSYGGTVEFLGNKEAVLHMNNGNDYAFSWE